MNGRPGVARVLDRGEEDGGGEGGRSVPVSAEEDEVSGEIYTRSKGGPSR